MPLIWLRLPQPCICIVVLPNCDPRYMWLVLYKWKKSWESYLFDRTLHLNEGHALFGRMGGLIYSDPSELPEPWKPLAGRFPLHLQSQAPPAKMGSCAWFSAWPYHFGRNRSQWHCTDNFKKCRRRTPPSFGAGLYHEPAVQTTKKLIVYWIHPFVLKKWASYGANSGAICGVQT